MNKIINIAFILAMIGAIGLVVVGEALIREQRKTIDGLIRIIEKRDKIETMEER